ncbi:MAG: dicarboxylate/amino acid:cation symporter [Verrucomicrobiota bacterium]
MDLAKINLTRYILIGMGAGIFVGLLVYFTGLKENAFVDEWILGGALKVLGDVFVRSLKLLVVPLVLVSLICGTAAMDDVRKLGGIGLKTLGLYMATTCIAISLGLTIASFVGPGEGMIIEEEVAYTAKEAPSFVEVLINIFPTNPFQAMVEGNMLQIIVFAILFGIALVLAGEKGKALLGVFNDLNEVIMKLVVILMMFAPVGVFAKITVVFADLGLEAIQKLGLYFILVVVVLLIHGLLVYPVFLSIFAKLNPFQFFKKFRNTQLFAFSTASSNATIPVTMRAVEERLGVDSKVSSFTVPLGATINMDGTAIMQGVATIFIANIAGVDLTMTQLLMVIVSATLASIGTAGVPGVGLITLAMVLEQAGLPIEYIGLIVGIDRLLDMVRTAVNVTGDAVVTCIVSKSEGQLNVEQYNEAPKP